MIVKYVEQAGVDAFFCRAQEANRGSPTAAMYTTDPLARGLKHWSSAGFG